VEVKEIVEFVAEKTPVKHAAAKQEVSVEEARGRSTSKKSAAKKVPKEEKKSVKKEVPQ